MTDPRPTPETPEEAQHVERILQLPYSFILIPEEGGGFSAQVLEFPGCFAQGETAGEAHENLRSAAHSWILAALDSRHTIPSPLSNLSHGNGWVRIQMPVSMQARAARIALMEGVTLEQFALATIAEKIGEMNPRPSDPQPNWAPRAELAFAMLEKSPEHYRHFLQPILIRALSDTTLRPLIDLVTTDPFFQHLLEGKAPEPFL